MDKENKVQVHNEILLNNEEWEILCLATYKWLEDILLFKDSQIH